MELNDCVKVILTQRGADILNAMNSNYKEQIPSLNWRTDYKDGDTYKTSLWSLFADFGNYMCAGAEITFTKLEYDK